MRKLFLKSLSILLLGIMSCQEDSFNVSQDINETVTTGSRSAGDGKYDVLGYGYNVTYPNLRSESCGQAVLDVNKLEKQGLIEPYKLDKSDFRYESGKDISEFTSNMASSLKLTEPAFLKKVIGGGSLNIAFGGNYSYSSDYSFAYCTQKYIDSRYRIAESDINVLRECCTQNFINKISTYTPAQIVEEYGTHVLKDIYVGAKLDVYLMAKSTTSTQKQNIEASLGVSLLKIFNVDAKFSYDSSLSTNNKQQSLYYSTVGGDPMAGLVGSLDPEKAPTVDLAAWSQTIKNSTPKFIDVDPNFQSFIPIYELISEPAKRQALKSYINSYIQSKEINSVTLFPTTVGMRTISGLGNDNEGGGVAIADINGNGKPDMILMGVDAPLGENRFWYKILFDLDKSGFPSRESTTIYNIQASGWDSAGGGIAISDINKNGKPDLILMCADRPKKGPANLCYRVVYDLRSDGSYTSLSSIKVISGMGDIFQGADIDICDINKNGIPDLVLMTYDNPNSKDNNFRYKIAFDLNAAGDSYNFSPRYQVDGVGYDGEGGGVAVGDIDNNGTLDIIFMALDAPRGLDSFRYRVLHDIDKYGASYSPLSDIIGFPDNFSPFQKGGGAGCCMYDIDNNGVLDIVFAAIDDDNNPNTWKYIMGSNLNRQGVPMQWR